SGAVAPSAPEEGPPNSSADLSRQYRTWCASRLGSMPLRIYSQATALLRAPPLREFGIGQKDVERAKEIRVRNERVRPLEHRLPAGNAAESDDISAARARREIGYSVSNHHDGAVASCQVATDFRLAVAAHQR